MFALISTLRRCFVVLRALNGLPFEKAASHSPDHEEVEKYQEDNQRVPASVHDCKRMRFYFLPACTEMKLPTKGQNLPTGSVRWRSP